MNILDDIKYKYRFGSPLVRIIIVNITVFVALIVLKLFTNLFYQQNVFSEFVFYWLGFPMQAMAFLYKPWTIITYMFIHDLSGIFHLLWNMLFLYWFGQIIEEFIGRSKTLPIYILGGIGGALLSLVLNSVMNYSGNIPLIGASGAVYGIMLAAVAITPNYQFNLMFIGPVSIKYIATFKILLDLLNLSELSNMGGHFCHIGGAITGYAYVYFLRQGTDLGWWIQRLSLTLSSLFQAKPKLNVVHKNTKAPNTSASISKQQKLDDILDKISKSGYESLSKEEKEFLFKASKD